MHATSTPSPLTALAGPIHPDELKQALLRSRTFAWGLIAGLPALGLFTALVAGRQLGVDARAPVAGLDRGVAGPDLHEQGVLPLLAGADGSLPPGVVAGGRDLQGVAPQAYGPLVTVLVDEVEHHITSWAKSAV